VQIQHLAISAWAVLAAGDAAGALQRMRGAAELEDGTEKSAVTPGPLAPARELLGEMLLQVHEPAQALQQFEAALRPRAAALRLAVRAARAAQLSGRPAGEREVFPRTLEVCARADQPPRSELRRRSRALRRD